MRSTFFSVLLFCAFVGNSWGDRKVSFSSPCYGAGYNLMGQITVRNIETSGSKSVLVSMTSMDVSVAAKTTAGITNRYCSFATPACTPAADGSYVLPGGGSITFYTGAVAMGGDGRGEVSGSVTALGNRGAIVASGLSFCGGSVTTGAGSSVVIPDHETFAFSLNGGRPF